MEGAARVCAIITGSVAFACGVVALSWWFDSEWLVYSSGAVQLVAFMTGFLGFLVMFGMLLDRAGGRKPTIGRSAVLSLILSEVPLLLLVGLAVVFASAIAGAVHAQVQTGGWGIYDPYGWHHCHWPLSRDHNTQHMCVSHERYIAVQKATDRIFVAFGIGFLAIECLAFTTLSRVPRPPRGRVPIDARA